MEREEEYYEEEREPEKSLLKGALLSPFAAVITVIVVCFALVAITLSTPFVFIVALIRLSFDFRLTGRYTLSFVDKIATVAFAIVYGAWYKIFHKGE